MNSNGRRKIIAWLLALLCALGTNSLSLAEESLEGPFVRIEVKDHGVIYAQLYPEYAPITVENFLKLTDEGFYDGLTFHRIISGFMVQGGDPKGNGTGGSSQTIKGEFSQNGVDNPLKHERGVLSMARSQSMDSASSQFFIMHREAPHLDGAYAAFGRVLSGIAVVDRLCQATPVQDNNGTVAAADQPQIASIRRAEWAEVQQAIDAEAENGLAGGVYVDPLSPLSFPVPKGWNRTGEAGSPVIFTHDSGTELILQVQDNWGPLPAATKAQLAQNGMPREALDTDAFSADGLISVIAPDPDAATQEEHGGVAFYTSEVTQGEPVTCFIGARDGYLYLWVFNGTRTDPLFADVLSMLDQMSFAE